VYVIGATKSPLIGGPHMGFEAGLKAEHVEKRP
jgi:hypothetical protein